MHIMYSLTVSRQSMSMSVQVQVHLQFSGLELRLDGCAIFLRCIPFCEMRRFVIRGIGEGEQDSEQMIQNRDEWKNLSNGRRIYCLAPIFWTCLSNKQEKLSSEFLLKIVFSLIRCITICLTLNAYKIGDSTFDWKGLKKKEKIQSTFSSSILFS